MTSSRVAHNRHKRQKRFKESVAGHHSRCMLHASLLIYAFSQHTRAPSLLDDESQHFKNTHCVHALENTVPRCCRPIAYHVVIFRLPGQRTAVRRPEHAGAHLCTMHAGLLECACRPPAVPRASACFMQVLRRGRSGRECACRPRAPAAAMALAPFHAQAGTQEAVGHRSPFWLTIKEQSS